jgi:hypothetical protein
MREERVFVLVPEAPAPELELPALASAPLVSGSLRLGYLDNGKGNADHLLRFIREALDGRLDIASSLVLRKQSVSLAAGSEIIDRFAREADLVVTAMAD